MRSLLPQRDLNPNSNPSSNPREVSNLKGKGKHSLGFMPAYSIAKGKGKGWSCKVAPSYKGGGKFGTKGGKMRSPNRAALNQKGGNMIGRRSRSRSPSDTPTFGRQSRENSPIVLEDLDEVCTGSRTSLSKRTRQKSRSNPRTAAKSPIRSPTPARSPRSAARSISGTPTPRRTETSDDKIKRANKSTLDGAAAAKTSTKTSKSKSSSTKVIKSDSTKSDSTTSDSTKVAASTNVSSNLAGLSDATKAADVSKAKVSTKSSKVKSKSKTKSKKAVCESASSAPTRESTRVQEDVDEFHEVDDGFQDCDSDERQAGEVEETFPYKMNKSLQNKSKSV